MSEQAITELTEEVRKLKSLLAARDENLKVEGAGWKDICDALTSERDELKAAQKIDADYIQWLCERLEESNADMRKYRNNCWAMAKKLNNLPKASERSDPEGDQP